MSMLDLDVTPSRNEMDAASQVGAHYLDEHDRLRGIEDGWATRIDVERLDLGSCCDCVVGQLTGHFWTGCTTLGIVREEAERYGFTLPNSLEQPRAAWEQLTACWRERIRERIPPTEEA